MQGNQPMLLVALVAIASLACGTSARAADRARELLAESEARHRTQTQEYAGDLTVTTREGKVRKKSWRSYREGYAGDARLLIRFVAPPEVRNVGFLSLGVAGKSPDQWLYLPSMKRERRIATQDRDASFVGTDFNYEDMEDFDHEKYDVELLREEPLGGDMCHVIEARPRARSLYARRVLWVRKDLLFLVQSESFKKDESEPSKRLVFSDLAAVDGHEVARRMEMRDLRKGSTTVVELKELAFDQPQPPGRFTLQNLVREDGD